MTAPGVLTPHAAEMMAAIAKVEEGISGLHAKVDDLTKVSVKRLDAHASKIDSLERTRDRQWGAAKLSGVGIMILAAVLGVLRWLK